MVYFPPQGGIQLLMSDRLMLLSKPPKGSPQLWTCLCAPVLHSAVPCAFRSTALRHRQASLGVLFPLSQKTKGFPLAEKSQASAACFTRTPSVRLPPPLALAALAVPVLQGPAWASASLQPRWDPQRPCHEAVWCTRAGPHQTVPAVVGPFSLLLMRSSTYTTPVTRACHPVMGCLV